MRCTVCLRLNISNSILTGNAMQVQPKGGSILSIHFFYVRFQMSIREAVAWTAEQQREFPKEFMFTLTPKEFDNLKDDHG